MRFRFTNLGPVKDTTLELGDLTVIAGLNNTGKTYTVYALYGFLRMWRQPPLVGRRSPREPPRLFPELRELIATVATEGSATWKPGDAILARDRAAYAKYLGKFFSRRHLPGVFSSRADFAGARLDLDIEDARLNDSYQATVPLQATLRFQPSLFGRTALTFEFEGSRLHVSLVDNGQILAAARPPRDRRNSAGATIPRHAALEAAVTYQYTRLLLDHLLPDPFILSAERFGISLFYKDLDYRRNLLVDALQKERYRKDRDRSFPYWLLDETTGRYSLPIKDNIDYTRSIPDLKDDRSELHDHGFFNDIKDLLGGYYSNAGSDLRFISKSRKEDRFNIPLHLASSSARGLSDLYFFLKHVARRDHLLIIDEPESHLDTANQVRLARVLSRLIGAGLRILITTHSDYLIKEINNLVMLSQLEDADRSVFRKLGYAPADRLRPQQVRAYAAEAGRLSVCRVDQYGIDFPVFDRTIDDINRRANELASRLPVETGA